MQLRQRADIERVTSLPTSSRDRSTPKAPGQGGRSLRLRRNASNTREQQLHLSAEGVDRAAPLENRPHTYSTPHRSRAGLRGPGLDQFERFARLFQQPRLGFVHSSSSNISADLRVSSMFRCANSLMALKRRQAGSRRESFARTLSAWATSSRSRGIGSPD